MESSTLNLNISEFQQLGVNKQCLSYILNLVWEPNGVESFIIP
jgi:hypothetical protein